MEIYDANIPPTYISHLTFTSLMPIPIPPLLSPYVSPAPAGSSALVTSVLDATSNWLILRFIHAALDWKRSAVRAGAGTGGISAEDQDENYSMVFVSVLRGSEQWREMGKKVVSQSS